MNIIKMLTPASVNGVTCRPARTMIPASVTIHNTGNKNADALRHAKSQSNGNLAASQVAVHYYVDDKAVYQCLEDNWQGWHAGDSTNSKGGNYTSIGIEVCEHTGIDQRKAFENAAELTARLCELYGFNAVKKHQDWTGKYCPRVLLDGTAGMTWEWFLGRFSAWMHAEEVPPLMPKVDNMPDSYAVDAVSRAIAKGVIRGNDKGDYMLHSSVTRQDLCVMLARCGVL